MTLPSPADRGGLSKAPGLDMEMQELQLQSTMNAVDGFLAITSQPLGPEVIYNHLHNNGLKLIKLVHFPEH